jgi:hypothetical protein
MQRGQHQGRGSSVAVVQMYSSSAWPGRFECGGSGFSHTHFAAAQTMWVAWATACIISGPGNQKPYSNKGRSAYEVVHALSTCCFAAAVCMPAQHAIQGQLWQRTWHVGEIKKYQLQSIAGKAVSRLGCFDTEQCSKC